jgi:hypothetical protein
MGEQSAVFVWYELLTADVSAAQSFHRQGGGLGRASRIDSTITAAAPRDATASVTAAAINAPAPAGATAAAPAASAATAATSAATAAATTTAAAAAAAATMTAAAAAAAARYLHQAAGAVFLVEDVECSKTHVRNFLFAQNEALIG